MNETEDRPPTRPAGHPSPGQPPEQSPDADRAPEEQAEEQDRSGLSDQPSDERRMLPWVLITLAVLAVAAWGVAEWTGWGESRREEGWKPEAPPPAADRTLDTMPPPPAPALAYQQFQVVCQEDAPTEAEQLSVYAATCLDHALETLRAAAGVQAARRQEIEQETEQDTEQGGEQDSAEGTTGQDDAVQAGEPALAPSLEEAETRVLRLQRAASSSAPGTLPVEQLTSEAARAVVAVAGEVAAGAQDLDRELVVAATAAADRIDPTVPLVDQGEALTQLFDRVGAVLQPLAQPSPPPAPVAP